MVFIVATYQHPNIPKIPVRSIAQSMDCQNAEKEAQLDNWDIQMIFRTLQQQFPAF